MTTSPLSCLPISSSLDADSEPAPGEDLTEMERARLQLKHAARRAMANRTTLTYGKPVARWAKEFDNQLQVAAAKRPISLLQARRAGQTIVGRPSNCQELWIDSLPGWRGEVLLDAPSIGNSA
ncbi:hypothetical protein [Kitasatospora xanthocidica]|uniref:hypothetical protein n=1 Tax=Kitasatospora xanthocidica TaxID=83382 RepID=UPI0016733B5A|nr:hypothetical protein [Kitasatospora xanthocidica]